MSIDSVEYTKEECEALRKKARNPQSKVLCPRCGKELTYRSVGNSYEVKCSTPGCIYDAVRGL